jgi:hypothetical protein
MNCKPGDLAVMVECPIREAVGLIVEVKSTSSRTYPRYTAPVWFCRAVTGAKADRGFCPPGGDCDIPDAWLRPIRADGIPDEEVRDLYLPKVPEAA